MKTHGIKALDPLLENRQLDWRVVSAARCPDEAAERKILLTQFRLPHDPWAPSQAYVRPVEIRRSRRRVLFRQESGTVA